MILSDICSYITEKHETSLYTIEDYVSTENMRPDKGGITSASSLPKGKATHFIKDDVLVSNIRPYFKKIWKASKGGICSGDVLCFRSKKNVNSDYLYYLLSQDIFFDYVMSGSKGTKMPRGDKGQIMAFNISLPTLSDQHRIASILSSLDRKIELNNKINAQLEEMAQAIFKSWFIEPKDYTLAKLEDVTVKVTDGVHNTVENVEGSPYLLLSCKNIVGGKLSISDKERTIGKETFETLRKRTKLERLDILISTVGTVGEVVLLNESPDFIEFQRSVGIIKTDREKASPYYVFLALKEKQKELKNTAHGAVQQCIFISDLKEFQIPLSEKSRIDNFDAVVEPIFTKIHILQKENLHLSQLRDTLLPKLMNGEIEIPDDDYLQHCLYYKGEEECPFPAGTLAAWYWRDEAMGQDENHRRIGHSFIEEGLQFIPLPAEQVQQLPSDIQDMLAYATGIACNMNPMGGDEYLKHYGKSIEELNEIDKK